MSKWNTADPNRYRGVPRHVADRIRRRDHWSCVICGHHSNRRRELPVDHRLNHQRGGTNADDNLQTLCVPCHNKKTTTERRAGQQARHDRLRVGEEPHPGLRRQSTHRVGGNPPPGHDQRRNT